MCLEKIGVIAGDSRVNGRETFFPFRMDTHLMPDKSLPDDYWYYQRAYYPIHDVIEYNYIENSFRYNLLHFF